MFRITDLPTQPDIASMELAWRMGDPKAAIQVQDLPGWEAYRDVVAEELWRKYGTTIKTFAPISMAQFSNLADGGQEILGFYQSLAEARQIKFSGRIVVAGTIRPALVIMRGRPGEMVCRTDYLSFKTLHVLEYLPPKNPAGMLV